MTLNTDGNPNLTPEQQERLQAFEDRVQAATTEAELQAVHGEALASMKRKGGLFSQGYSAGVGRLITTIAARLEALRQAAPQENE